ncbi:hypothetical protein IEU95_10125 [Hoyosella rhizosphaerae]|uniref:Uncharacterized protein n=1 Tax=Hoyosella rhizosphaerae TaxID=1755582 RepID=A0A916X8Z8_9ACTN|nr:hypothetical protein [Hoyosella rhizosphaerae]MBN4927191.1 hypothetical protein [Hoyosella rhizosphaerae]GGC53302.1 hypothetical protein GCM10011410_02040 [Hoyosella rhizosphaerae]
MAKPSNIGNDGSVQLGEVTGFVALGLMAGAAIGLVCQAIVRAMRWRRGIASALGVAGVFLLVAVLAAVWDPSGALALGLGAALTTPIFATITRPPLQINVAEEKPWQSRVVATTLASGAAFGLGLVAWGRGSLGETMFAVVLGLIVGGCISAVAVVLGNIALRLRPDDAVAFALALAVATEAVLLGLAIWLPTGDWIAVVALASGIVAFACGIRFHPSDLRQRRA